MTKARPSKHRTGLLKTTVVTGGILATVLGTNLLAQHDIQVAAAEAAKITQSQPGITEPLSTTLQLDSTGLEAMTATSAQLKPLGLVATWKPTLKPIPTVAGSAMPNNTFASNFISNSNRANNADSPSMATESSNGANTGETSAEASSAAIQIELPPLPSVAAPSTVAIPNTAAQSVGDVLNFELREIPSVQMPPPVSRSKSSK